MGNPVHTWWWRTRAEGCGKQAFFLLPRPVETAIQVLKKGGVKKLDLIMIIINYHHQSSITLRLASVVRPTRNSGSKKALNSLLVTLNPKGFSPLFSNNFHVYFLISKYLIAQIIKFRNNNRDRVLLVGSN